MITTKKMNRMTRIMMSSGRRSGRVFFLVVVLVPWVAGWAVLSFSLRSWCHGSSPGQWFLSLCGLGAMGRGLGNVFFVVGHRSQAGQFGLSFGLSPTCRLLVLLRTYDFWFSTFVERAPDRTFLRKAISARRRFEAVFFSGSLCTFAPSERVSNGYVSATPYRAQPRYATPPALPRGLCDGGKECLHWQSTDFRGQLFFEDVHPRPYTACMHMSYLAHSHEGYLRTNVKEESKLSGP